MARDTLGRDRAPLPVRDSLESALLEHTSEVLILLDAHGTQTYVSPSVRRLTGHTPEALLGLAHEVLCHPDDREGLTSTLQGLSARSGEVPLRLRLFTTAGEYVWVEGSARDLRDDPRVEALLLTYRDASERVQLEERLLQSRKLESIGQLAGGIAHDFNNLLTGVLGNAQLVLMQPSHPERVRERARQIEEYARRAADLTSQLLSFARKRAAQPRHTDLNALIVETRTLLTRLIGDHIEIVTRLSPGLGLVEVDPTQLQQVILNLAVNARDAMPEGGTLTISTCAEIPPTGRGHVVLSVADTGQGMGPDTLRNVFEPFFTTKTLGRGTGLGLATSHDIVSRAGGRIEVESAPDQGARFAVFLPLTEQPAATPTLDSGVIRTPRGRETVLLVDDEAAVREPTAEALEGLGYTVLRASHGALALEVAARYPGEIHAVVTDVVMPHLGGPALVRELRAERPGIASVFISGYDGEAGRSLRDAGAPLVDKPFEVLVLAHALRDALDARPQGRARPA